jgi:putative ABC transport system permease protein
MKRFSFRQILVVVQFAISIILIVGTIIAYQQLNYLKEARLGFDKEQVIIVPLNNGLPISKWDAMIKNFTDHPNIENVSSADHIIGNDHQTDSYRVDGQQDDNQIAFISVGENFIETFGIELITGRDFTREFRGDTSFIPGIVNEAFVAKMGLKSPADAINKKLYKTGKRTVKIVGVASDFHFASLHHSVTPLVLEGPAGIFDGMGAKYMAIRFDGSTYQDVMKHSEATLGEFFPNTPYEFFFLDQNLEALYKTENIMSKVITTFSVFALLVACMGLLGLTAFAAEKRTKELGVRKVLGATERNLIYLLGREFIILVIIAFAIAVPISWIGLNSWLNDFAFRVNIEWWIFILAGLTTLSLALITVSIQAYKAAHANPIDSLSYE